MRGCKGEKHHAAKLTNNQVLAIRASKEGTKALAERYGVSKAAIQKIRRGDTWKHLTPQQSS